VENTSATARLQRWTTALWGFIRSAPLHHRNLYPLAGEQRRQRRAGIPSADDHYFKTLGQP